MYAVDRIWDNSEDTNSGKWVKIKIIFLKQPQFS